MAILDITDHGAKGDGHTDNTTAIASAIAAAKSGDIVLVPVGRFMVDAALDKGVALKSDMALHLTSGAILQAITSVSPVYAIVRIWACSNVLVSGPGLIKGERDTHVPKDVVGQYGAAGAGFGIWIGNGASNIQVQNIWIQKCWGDGVIVQGAKNVSISLLKSDFNRRHAMSVIDVNGLTVRNSSFMNNDPFKHPGCGMDCECDLETQGIQNVIIEYCSFANNVGASLSFGAPGIYKNIVVRNCQFDCKTQPISVSGNAGSLGTPWWAFALNRSLGSLGSPQNLGVDPWYRWWGYPTSWSSK